MIENCRERFNTYSIKEIAGLRNECPINAGIREEINSSQGENESVEKTLHVILSTRNLLTPVSYICTVSYSTYVPRGNENIGNVKGFQCGE
jgi:hypothetical protein